MLSIFTWNSSSINTSGDNLLESSIILSASHVLTPHLSSYPPYPDKETEKERCEGSSLAQFLHS